MPPDNDTKKYVPTASVSRTLLMDCVLYVSTVKPIKKKKEEAVHKNKFKN